jgi:hypothetical protein
VTHYYRFISERLKQHEDNLAMWREPDGFLCPTEPDSEEREKVRLQLKAAIHELQLVQREIDRGRMIGDPGQEAVKIDVQRILNEIGEESEKNERSCGLLIPHKFQ